MVKRNSSDEFLAGAASGCAACQQASFLRYCAPEAREIQFTLLDVLKVPPISGRGDVDEIIGKFGGADRLRDAVSNPNRCCMRRDLICL